MYSRILAVVPVQVVTTMLKYQGLLRLNRNFKMGKVIRQEHRLKEQTIQERKKFKVNQMAKSVYHKAMVR